MCDREVVKRAWSSAGFCCCQPFLEASSPRALLEGRGSWRGQGAGTDVSPCEAKLEASMQIAGETGPWEQEAQLQISVVPLPPPFLKRKVGRKPSKALNLFLYFSCVKRSLIPWELGWTQECCVRGRNAKARTNRGSLWQISVCRSTQGSFFQPCDNGWRTVLQCCAIDKQHLWAQKWYQTCLEFTEVNAKEEQRFLIGFPLFLSHPSKMTFFFIINAWRSQLEVKQVFIFSLGLNRRISQRF